MVAATLEYAGGGASSVNNTGSNATTVAVPLLSSTAKDQPMILAVASDATTGSWTTPAGWQVLQASAVVPSGTADMVSAVYYKYSSGAESSSVTVTGPSGHLVGASISLRGASSGSLAANIGQSASVDTSTTSPTSGGTLNPAVRGNGLAVRICLCSSKNSALSATLTPPASGWTTRQNFINSNSSTSQFCTGVCISTQLGSAPAAAATASASGGSAWTVVDAWFIDGAFFRPPPLKPLVARMRANNW